MKPLKYLLALLPFLLTSSAARPARKRQGEQA